MFRTAAPEVRTTASASLHDVKRHFFFDGTVYEGDRFKRDSGAMGGTVKILPLRGGRWSLRSIGKNRRGRTIHVTGNTRLVADGIETTVESHYWRIQNHNRSY